MRLTLLVVGRVKKGWVVSGCQEYLERLPHYFPTRVVEVKDEVGHNLTTDEVRRREGLRLREKIPPGSHIICLDEFGKSWTSTQCADFLAQQRDSGLKELTLVIGGPLGLDRSLMASAHTRLSLSSMTLPHELARLILLEQLYRACTILKGEPYHNP